jgi:hypothetical protein
LPTTIESPEVKPITPGEVKVIVVPVPEVETTPVPRPIPKLEKTSTGWPAMKFFDVSNKIEVADEFKVVETMLIVASLLPPPLVINGAVKLSAPNVKKKA